MELFRALGALTEPPSDETAEIAALLALGDPPPAGEHERLFLFSLYPYASVYLGEEGRIGGEARDRIAGFWRAMSWTPPPEVDHLASLLGLYARLVDETTSLGSDPRHPATLARRAFFWEHLASWLPVYCHKLTAVARRGYYLRWAELLLESLVEEATALGLPEVLPLHLRSAPPLTDPRADGATGWIESLLAPARSGWIVVEDNLREVANELGIASRKAERAFALKALLGQDPKGVLLALGRRASEEAAKYDERLGSFGPVAEHWSARARRSADLLRELSADAGWAEPVLRPR